MHYAIFLTFSKQTRAMHRFKLYAYSDPTGRPQPKSTGAIYLPGFHPINQHRLLSQSILHHRAVFGNKRRYCPRETSLK